MLGNKAYYLIKPLLPWRVRFALRASLAKAQRPASKDVWPIDQTAGATPPGWPGWPDGKEFALVLTHDVEGLKGLQRIKPLMDLELRLGFKSSFNLVPEEEYEVSDELLQMLDQAGFEAGVHGLEHDGKLYSSRAGFVRKAARINAYISRWRAIGFRSPLMQHRLGWLHRLKIEYDSSSFDTDPFEPEPDSFRTIFPFWVPGRNGDGFVELPYTLAQDSTLFVILREPGIGIWKKKLDWIAQRGGMAMLITHPDYMNFEGRADGRGEFSASFYEEFLTYVREEYKDRCWVALPRDVNRHYRAKTQAGARNTRQKICMIAYARYDSDNRIRRYAESLAARGDIVDVIALQSPDRDPAYELNGVSVFQIQGRPEKEGGKWSQAWQLLQFLWRAFVFTNRRHRRVKYDLVHVHNIPDFLVLAAVYPKLTGAKIILDIHDLVPELFEGKFKSRSSRLYAGILKIVEKLSIAFSDHVIVSNHLWERRLVARSVRAEKCSVFVNNVDPATFSRRARVREDNKIILLFPGSFQSHQGLDVAIKALGRLKVSVPNCELHLYGGGGGRDAKRRLVDLASSMGVADRVRFFGMVSLDRIPQIMANADIGVVPKLANQFGNEAYSTKIMEFMSQGVPVVVSRTAVDTYYFGDDTVCFFEPGNDQAMADALIRLIGDRELRETMSRKGLEYATANSWNSKKSSYFSLVDGLCAEM